MRTTRKQRRDFLKLSKKNKVGDLNELKKSMLELGADNKESLTVIKFQLD